MSVHSVSELLSALKDGRFDALLGTQEGPTVDFRQLPYALDTLHGRWELARDIASFANAGGGHLLIGIQTELVAFGTPTVVERPYRLNADDTVRRVAAVRPLPQDLLDLEQCEDVIDDWIYPQVEGVTFTFFPEGDESTRAHANVLHPEAQRPEGARSGGGSRSSAPATEREGGARRPQNRGIWSLYVPSQAPTALPFLTRRMASDDGRIIHAAGAPIRRNARISWMRPESVLRMSGADTTLSERLGATVQRRNETVVAHHHAQSFLRVLGWQDRPCLVLQAQPTQPLRLREHLFDSQGLYRAVCDFHARLAQGALPHFERDPEQPERALLAYDSHVSSRTDEEGWFEVAVPMAFDLIAKARSLDGRIAARVLVSSAALVELLFAFFRFLHAQLRPLGSAPWHIWMRTIGRNGGPSAGPHSEPDPQDFYSYGTAERDAQEALRRIGTLECLPPQGASSEQGVKAALGRVWG